MPSAHHTRPLPSRPPAAPSRRGHRLPARGFRAGVATRLAGLAVLCCCASAQAAPATRAAPAPHAIQARHAAAAPVASGDALSRFLLERGLVERDPAADAGPAVPAAAGDAAAAAALVRQRGFTQALGERAAELVAASLELLGVRYRRGGDSAAEGFDCSGFTRHVFERALGLVLPRRADEQASAQGLLRVARSELRPGDLVFFDTLRRSFSHVGIYLGDGKFVHAPRSGAAVRVEDMRYAYWARRFDGARRAPGIDAVATPAPAAAVPAAPELTPY